MNIYKQNTPPDDHDAEVDEAEHETVFSGAGTSGTETSADGEAKTKKATT